MLHRPSPEITERDNTLVRGVAGGGPEAAAAEHTLLQLYAGGLKSVLSEFSIPEDLYDDCLQAARIGFISAVRRFSPDRGNALWSYAVHFIRGEVRHLLQRERVHWTTLSIDGMEPGEIRKLERHLQASTTAKHEPSVALDVRAFVRSLPARHMLTVKRVCWDGASQAQVARELGVSRMMVTKIMHTVRSRAIAGLGLFG